LFGKNNLLHFCKHIAKAALAIAEIKALAKSLQKARFMI